MKKCAHRFRTVKKGKVYKCRKCGKENRGIAAILYRGRKEGESI